MSKFGKHLGQDNEVVIEDETFKLKNLGTESLPDYLNAAKAFGGIKEDAEDADFLSNLTDESIVAIKNLINDTLEISYPEDWKDNPDELKQFGFKYLMVLLPKILEINSASIPQTHEEIKSRDVKQRIAQSQQPKDE